jgi:hypothetical protein
VDGGFECLFVSNRAESNQNKKIKTIRPPRKPGNASDFRKEFFPFIPIVCSILIEHGEEA